MKGIITLALAFQIWALTGAGAETISVPLPIIQGRYYVDLSIPAAYYNRQEHFEVGKIPLSVTGVSLHISGTFVVGETSCWLSDPADPDTFPQSLEFFAWLDDTTGAWDPMADAVSGTESGTFEYTMPFSRASHEVN